MAAATIETRIDALCDQYPCIAKLIANGEEVRSSTFLTDVRDKLLRFGVLSPKQIEAVDRSISRSAQYALRREAIEAERIALKARGVEAPEGDCKVTGEIVSVKATKYGYGIVVRCAEGYAVWLNLPTSLRRSVSDIESIRGRSVEFDATLTRSDRDPLFAFAKRPTNATYIN